MTPLHVAIGPAGAMEVSGEFGIPRQELESRAGSRSGPGSRSEARRSTVRALLDGGADVNAVDASGTTALHLAASPGGLGIITELIARGANVNARDSDGFTPLHLLAMLSDEAEAAHALIRAGADANAQDRFGKRPIDYTGARDQPDIPRALIDAGADTSTIDKGWRRKIAKAIMKDRARPSSRP